MYPPIRINGEQYGQNDRLCPAEAAEASVQWDQLRFSPEEFAIRAQNMERLVVTEPEGCPVEEGEGIRCRAGVTSFWMTWDGRMRPCGMMTVPEVLPLEIGFDAAWEQLRAAAARIRTPAKCVTCDHSEICGVCPSVCCSETGRFDGVPEYLCERAQQIVAFTQQAYKEGKHT
jgi:sulfatase maturation enzyme AslB (radical SAM superfamily)